MAHAKVRKPGPEIPLIGDVDDWEAETIKSLLEIRSGGECVFYLDSSGGSVYGALAVVNLLQLKRIQSTVVVLGECSSAAMLIFGVAKRRLVTPMSTLLFHPMRWQSEKRISSAEAKQWSAHFDRMEKDMAAFLAKLFGPFADHVFHWTQNSQYLTGIEIAAIGLAELING